ncbi:MAG: 3-dehydroquinate synthase [Lentisphaeria bacterium]
MGRAKNEEINGEKMQQVQVPVLGSEYKIFIGRDFYNNLSLPSVRGKQCLIVTDSNVKPLYGEAVKQVLYKSQASKVETIDFSAGEEHKTLTTMQKFYSTAAQLGMDRKSIIIALGGGVTGDMAGFLAASYMRGINFIQIPTTLLAMVDSSVGGKVGIDLPEGKNLVGAFWQPLEVIIDIKTLSTLPMREIRCGLAEIIKYGMIYDSSLLGYIEVNVKKLMNLDYEVYEKVIKRCCEIKADIVGQDEKEQGIRAILNYGHTFGHSIEMLGGFSLLNHGEGVAIGMTMAAQLAVDSGLISQEIADRQERILSQLGLPTKVENMDAEAIFAGMKADKKTESGCIRLVLPCKQLGNVAIYGDVSNELIINAIRKHIVTK